MSSAPWLHVAIKHDAAYTLPLLGETGLCCWQQEAATWARVIKQQVTRCVAPHHGITGDQLESEYPGPVSGGVGSPHAGQPGHLLLQAGLVGRPTLCWCPVAGVVLSRLGCLLGGLGTAMVCLLDSYPGSGEGVFPIVWSASRAYHVPGRCRTSVCCARQALLAGVAGSGRGCQQASGGGPGHAGCIPCTCCGAFTIAAHCDVRAGL
jgi:hypothetical protein